MSKELELEISDDVWDRLQIVLERRQETPGEYLHYLLKVGILTSETLFGARDNPVD